MTKITEAGGVYKKSGKDRRELLFFILLAVFIFIKFYFLEGEISKLLTRMPLSLMASAAFITGCALLVSLLWRKVRLGAALLLDFLFTALILTDALHMRYYSDLFSFHNLGLSTQVGEISDSVFALFSPTDLLYFVDFPLLIAFWYLTKRFSTRAFFHKISFKRLSASLLGLLLCVSLFAFHIWNYNRRIPGVLTSMWDRPAVCNNIGAVAYHATDSWNTLRGTLLKNRLSEEEKARLKEQFSELTKQPVLMEGTEGVAKGKNLIIMQVESLQSFVIGLKYKGKEVTPNINAFMKEASFATAVYNQTGPGNSSDAEFLVNAGLYPAASGVAYTRFAGNRYEALPTLLRQHGYSVLAIHGDRAGFWNRGHMYPALGIDNFISRKELKNDEAIGMGLSDRTVFNQSLQLLKKEKKPFYAFIVTLTSHYPFNFQGLAKKSGFDSGEFEGTVPGDYLSAIHYFDTQFGRFLKGLKSKGLYKDTVIIVYGDHNAIPKWDSPTLGRLLGKSISTDREWRNISKVPLIINIPGVKKLKQDKSLALGLINLPSAAASLLGFEYRAGLGTNIFAKASSDSPVIFRNGSYITKESYVKPAEKRAVNLRTGQELSYEAFAEQTKKVAEILALNDKILDYDLLPFFLKGTGNEK